MDIVQGWFGVEKLEDVLWSVAEMENHETTNEEGCIDPFLRSMGGEEGGVVDDFLVAQ